MERIEMTGADVIDFYAKSKNLGIEIWIDGGWAVDALLGKQTRPHEDLDIVVEQKDASKLRQMLEVQGYEDVPRDDTSAWNFVLGDDKGHLIDFHVIVFDEKGSGIYGPAEKGEMYPAASLTGTGKISGQPVRCISAEYMIKFLTPWVDKHREKYAPAIAALREKFGE